ncbi:hypothetical protein [Pseudaestuariivita rosea]|uniref:hypothetical protein n=1 Tax=Pseudaestuariivita rosea TaxID=2763263 RepID=UPI001ABA0ABF|nr:hypothetical protein [Pseudaestuariivita rosea]
MEALLLIISELLFIAIYPFVAFVGGIIAAIFEAVLTFFAMLLRPLFERNRKKQTNPKTSPVRPKRKGRKYLHWIAAPLIFVGAVIVALNYLFFEPALSFALDQIEDRTSYDIEFTAASGDIFTGRLAISGFEIRDQAGREAGLMLGSASDFEIDVNMWTLLSRDVVLEKLVLNDAVGTIILPPESESQNENRPEQDAEPRRKRGFVVENLAFSDIEVLAVTADQTSHSLQIIQATSQPFRSRMAVFDLFFRSNMNATVDGVPLVVSTETISDNGRRTVWRFDDFPVTAAAVFVDRAPFTWLNGGTISANVQDAWDLSDQYIDMDWRLDLKDTDIAAPPEAGRTQRLMIAALDRVVEQRDGNASLGFQMRFDQDGLRNGATGDMTVFWDALVAGVTKAISDNLGERAEETQDRLNGIGNRIRDIFQREN